MVDTTHGSVSVLRAARRASSQARDARRRNTAKREKQRGHGLVCCMHFPQRKVVASWIPRISSWIGFKTRTLACSVCTLNHVTCIQNSHIQGIERHLIHLRTAEHGIHWIGLLDQRPQRRPNSACHRHCSVLYVIFITSGQRSRSILHKSDAIEHHARVLGPEAEARV